MLKHLKHHWKRAASGLMALVMAAGLLPGTSLAAETAATPVIQTEAAYAPTGNFELNVAGTTAWNGGAEPFTVYSTQAGTTQVTEIPAGEPFALLEDSGGDRLTIGYSEDGWTGGTLEDTGWVDKADVLVNLPDLIPSIAYVREDAEKAFNSRLTRFEYVIPCPYGEAERLARLQAEAMEGGETLVVRMDGQTVTVSRAVGDPTSLEEYTLDGETYRKYGQWTESSPADSGISAYQLPYEISTAYSADPSVTLGMFAPQTSQPSRAPSNVTPTGDVGAYWSLQPRQPRRTETPHLQRGLGHRPGADIFALHPGGISGRRGYRPEHHGLEYLACGGHAPERGVEQRMVRGPVPQRRHLVQLQRYAL